MWAEYTKILSTFESAVLTGFDSSGYPLSMRCHPQAVAHEQVLTVAIPATVDLQSGPACLLVHAHNEQLWDLRSYLVRGRLERQGESAQLLVEKLTPGAGMGGPLAVITLIRNARRTANNYLQKRNLPRPTVPWEKLAACKPK